MTPAILYPLAVLILGICAWLMGIFLSETIDALAWWRDFLAGVAQVLWLRFVAWRGRVGEAFTWRGDLD